MDYKILEFLLKTRVLLLYATVFGILSAFRTLKMMICTQGLYVHSRQQSNISTSLLLGFVSYCMWL